MAVNLKPKFVNHDVIYFEYLKPTRDQNIYVWDIDKTYLDTQFDSFKGLLRTAFEKAFQKKNIPGTATLIRALEKTSAKDTGQEKIPIYFISASPPQMERKIYQKMSIDQIYPRGIFFKDNLKNIRPSKFKRLKQQVGYKVHALLELRLVLPENAKIVLFGDDSESDALVYSLFSDICSRRLQPEEYLSILEALHTQREQRKKIFELQKKCPVNDPVERIYINLVTDTDPEYYSKFGKRVVATFTTFQAALDLYQTRKINKTSLIDVARDMINNYGFTIDELAKSFDDLVKRRILAPALATDLMAELKAEGLLPNTYSFALTAGLALQNLQRLGEKFLGIEPEEPSIPDSIDYLSDIR